MIGRFQTCLKECMDLEKKKRSAIFRYLVSVSKYERGLCKVCACLRGKTRPRQLTDSSVMFHVVSCQNFQTCDMCLQMWKYV